ncbi:hypothetical protein LS72_005850 [Helicobacter apodemus]|uniref:DUF2202 domain-containing protein n=1 Tax=Helicobacter apodemus TaxID=135569 RepID=A0A4U8UFX2_9HELI|nr:hypothetical protein [Helicobacter apodemus]MDE6958004.1 hypothetical protein [Helicobacter apodemus]TLE15758.1 hypothetical protein LS72_005850 [Helicobacter apodemus]
MTTQENLTQALDNEYKAYSFYANASKTFGFPFNQIFSTKLQDINALNLHLTSLNIPIPTNPYINTILPNTLEETLQNAISNENTGITLYNTLITQETDMRALDTFYLLQAASFNHHIPTLQNFLYGLRQNNKNPLEQIHQGKALLDETGTIITQLQNGNLSQGELEGFLNKLNYSLIGGIILGAFGAIILNEFLNREKE